MIPWVLGGIGGFIFLLVLYSGYRVYLLVTPTKGPEIDRQARQGEVLLVIDVQKDFTRKTGKNSLEPKSVERAIAAINREAADANARGVPVVTIRQVLHTPLARLISRLLIGPEGLAGSSGIGLDERLSFKAAADFEKDRGDAFCNPDLEAWLAEREIGRLRLAGLDGCYCVANTARGALNRGYGVSLAEEGIMTAFPERWDGLKSSLVSAG